MRFPPRRRIGVDLAVTPRRPSDTGGIAQYGKEVKAGPSGHREAAEGLEFLAILGKMTAIG